MTKEEELAQAAPLREGMETRFSLASISENYYVETQLRRIYFYSRFQGSYFFISFRGIFNCTAHLNVGNFVSLSIDGAPTLRA